MTKIAFKLTIIAVCTTLTLLSTGVQGQTEVKHKPGLTPEKIIAKMVKTYANCKSYQDTGTVKTVFIMTNRKRINEKPFATVFIRPDQFRFEYKEKVDSYIKEKPCYIVWRNGSKVLTWFFVRPDIIEKGKSFSSAIAGATGVSSGSARRIPALLLPEIKGRKFSNFKELKMLKDGTFDNVNCFRIQGKFIYSRKNDKVVRKPTTIWIEKDRFIIRRVDEETVFVKSNFRTKTTTTYYPFLDDSIPNKMLKFDPPSGNKIQAQKKKPTTKGPTRIFMDGYCLSAKQAAKLEQKLIQNPDDFNTITKLLGYLSSIYRGDNAARQKRDKYILWMIEHHPDAVILDWRLNVKSDAAKKLWIKQVKKNPNNPQVLWNAANSVSSVDKKLAEKFYIKGQPLDPENPKWTERLGNYYFWGKQPEKALNEYRKAYPKTKNKVLAISRMAKSALDCGKIQEAGKYALEMQQLAAIYGNRNENYAKLLFNANLTLGRIALKQGKTDEAGRYLLEASRTPASLKSMPDFTLPKELLAAGQKIIVLEFLQSCSRFWDKALCKEWIKQIDEGKIPDFKYNPYARQKSKK